MIDNIQTKQLVPLDRALPGQRATIALLVGCPEHVRRLEEMGLRRGTTVEIVRSGKPCIVRAGGNRLCLRCNDLLGVLVHQG